MASEMRKHLLMSVAGTITTFAILYVLVTYTAELNKIHPLVEIPAFTLNLLTFLATLCVTGYSVCHVIGEGFQSTCRVIGKLHEGSIPTKTLPGALVISSAEIMVFTGGLLFKAAVWSVFGLMILAYVKGRDETPKFLEVPQRSWLDDDEDDDLCYLPAVRKTVRAKPRRMQDFDIDYKYRVR